MSVPVRSNDNKPDARAMTKRFFHNASGWAQVPDSWAGWHEATEHHRSLCIVMFIFKFSLGLDRGEL